jgi:Mg2+ and Co2+ transporter CorA
LENLQAQFDLHPLVVEDARNCHQRACRSSSGNTATRARSAQ